MTKEFLLVIVVILSLCIPIQVRAIDCGQVEGAFRQAEQIRGLKKLRAVPCRVVTKPEVQEFLKSEIERKVPKAKLAHEEQLFKLLGLIPNSFNYKDGLVKLYSDQVGGFYEPEKEYYAMAAWIPDVMQQPVAVHELTHALQDQHYALEKLVNDLSVSTDEMLARSAVIEGDATAVMLDYSFKLAGGVSLSEQPTVGPFLMQNILGAGVTVGLQNVPSALQQMLIFPYTSGLRFAHEQLKVGEYREIDRAFKKLPISTTEILHPEIYRRGDWKLDEIEVDDLPLGARELHRDRVGEFVIATLLASYIPAGDASAAASGWQGERAVLYELDNKYGLSWNTSWANINEAHEFAEGLKTAYQARFSSNWQVSASEFSMLHSAAGDEVWLKVVGKLVKVSVNSP